MKEDILEQLVDDYFQAEGYFTRHNIKFRPRRDHPDFKSNKDSNHSDIDVIGIHPKRKGFEEVVAVSCKSWQGGFRIATKIDEIEKNKKVSGRVAWQAFRELTIPKWSEAFIDAVETATGSRKFTYVLAVTVIVGDRGDWERYPRFVEAMGGNPIRLIDLTEMLNRIRSTSTTTVASSTIGRVLQLMRAAEKGKKALVRAVQAQTDDDNSVNEVDG
jgi:hypothetical protein